MSHASNKQWHYFPGSHDAPQRSLRATEASRHVFGGNSLYVLDQDRQTRARLAHLVMVADAAGVKAPHLSPVQVVPACS